MTGKGDEQLREEFNRWAEDGRGEGMEEDHLPIVLPVLELMQLAPTDNVLDVGCGAGWLVARIAPRVPEGRVIGMDVSDEMVRRARRNYVHVPHALFIEGGVDEIPWEDAFFQKVVTVESAYYWPDPARGVREIFRVLADEGTAWLLINYYRDNPHCHQWGRHYRTPAHLLSAEEWAQHFRAAGFADVAHRRIPRHFAVARGVQRPLVPRCGTAPRVQGRRRAAGPRTQTGAALHAPGYPPGSPEYLT